MTPAGGTPLPGDRPGSRHRAQAGAAGRARPSAERTRQVLAERRAQALGGRGPDAASGAPSAPGVGERPPRSDRVGPSGTGDGRGFGGGRGSGDGRGPRWPGSDGAPPRGGGDVFRRRRIAAVGGAAAAIVGLWLVLSLFQPFKGDGEGRVQVTIPNGAGLGEIGDLLEREGIVSSGFFFELRTRLAGGGEDLKAGTYQLREDMSYGAALDALTAGGGPARVVNVTIPEGRSRGEVAAIVEEAGLEGDYEKATRNSPALDPADYGAEDADSLEGFLFPSTYELKPRDDVDDLVRKQLQTFEDEFGSVNLRQAERANLTPYDVLIIASMVERETQVPRERPIVASVIYNRLSQGEPLGIDATTRFDLDNWDKPLTESELATDTPYNTRLNAGLPPGPIGSPGLDSIEAAAAPKDTDFFYYVVEPGTCGEHVFTETAEEFEAAVAEYDSARAEAGGQSPTDCPE